MRFVLTLFAAFFTGNQVMALSNASSGGDVQVHAGGKVQVREGNKVPSSNLQSGDSLPEVVRQTLALHFGESEFKSVDDLAKSFAVPAKYKRAAGMFVTLSRKGKTRACWGSINPQYPNLVEGAVYTTESALSKEYRYKKVGANEWQFLKPQVTVVRAIEPLNSLSSLNPLLHGLMVRSGGKAAVILPGEAVDAHYQLMLCKVKAGISSTQPCQMYRIKADVFK